MPATFTNLSVAQRCRARGQRQVRLPSAGEGNTDPFD
jgi:hypothetical protein